MNMNMELKYNSNFLEDYKKSILYTSFSSKKQNKKMNISIKNKSRNSINLFGDGFTKENKKKCRIIYENKLKELETKINIKQETQNYRKTNLLILDNISYIKGMFYKCENLISIKNLEAIETKNIKDFSYLFSECKLIETLPNISNWNIIIAVNISALF